MLTGDELLAKVRELTITEPTKPLVSQEQSIGRTHREMTETTITKENLDRLWTALEYTRATISPRNCFISKEPDWVEVHKSRAHQSNAYLEQAIKIINQMRKELK